MVSDRPAPMLNRVTLAFNVQVGFDALRIHPLRTMLSVLGIIIGAGSLVTTMAVSDGMMAYAREQVTRETTVQEVTVSSRTRDYREGEWFPVRNFPVFSTQEAEQARRDIPGVRAATLTLGGSSSAQYRGVAHRVNATLSTADLADFTHLDFAGGRFFTAVEAAHNALVVVVNYALAKRLVEGHDPLSLLDREITVRRRNRRVVGILAPNPYEGARNPSLAIYVPIRGAETVLDPPLDGRFTPTIHLRAGDVESVRALREATIDWLARRYLRWDDRIDVEVGLERLAKVERIFLLAKLFIGALVGISLVVGGIGIMNVMLASVVERTREIGIRKAIGARSTDVKIQFLAESVAIAAMGTMIGLVLGVVVAVGLAAVFRYFTGAAVHPVVSPNTVLVAIASSALVGLAFGTYPARRAANLAPIDAIAHE